jgi:hypothetical protein
MAKLLLLPNLDHESGEGKLLRNIDNYLTIVKLSHHKRFQSSLTRLIDEATQNEDSVLGYWQPSRTKSRHFYTFMTITS